MIYEFDELLAHVGHEIECVYYGENKEEAVNAAIECVTCGCVLVDLDRGDTISKDLAEDEISPDGEEISVKWSTADVFAQAENDKVTLTEEQAKEILERIKKNHDASIGINWEVISCHISMYFQEKENG